MFKALWSLISTLLLLAVFVFGLAVYLHDDDADAETEQISTKINMPELVGKPEAVELVSQHWDKLLDHCPGLNKYQADLTFEKLDNRLNNIYKPDMSRVEIFYRVSNAPKVIPNKFRVNGHRCGFGISPYGTIRIQKNVCVAVCLDKVVRYADADYIADLFNGSLMPAPKPFPEADPDAPIESWAVD